MSIAEFLWYVMSFNFEFFGVSVQFRFVIALFIVLFILINLYKR